MKRNNFNNKAKNENRIKTIHIYVFEHCIVIEANKIKCAKFEKKSNCANQTPNLYKKCAVLFVSELQ